MNKIFIYGVISLLITGLSISLNSFLFNYTIDTIFIVGVITFFGLLNLLNQLDQNRKKK